MTPSAEMPEYNGEELFNYSGTIVWVLETSLAYNFMRLAVWPGGTEDIITIPYQTLESASPEDLEGII